MKISLKNFRSFTKKEVEIPDSGMIQLSGNSEVGKTTILEGIVWGLFGNDGTKNVTPLSGSNKTNVQLQYKDLAVERTKTPNTFTCNGVQDEVAQGVVDSAITNVEHFKLSSYVQQKMKNCFLSLTPKQQLDFLDRLAIDIDIEKYKDVVKGKIRTLQSSVQEEQNRIEYVNQNISSTLASIDMVPHFSLSDCDYESIYHTKESQINDALLELKNLRNTKNQKEQLVKDPRREIDNQISRIEEGMINVATELILREDSIPSLTQEDMIDIPLLTSEINQLFSIISSSRQYISGLTDLETKHGAKYVHSLRESYAHVFQSKSDALTSSKQALNALESALKVAKQVKECPECGAHLKIVFGEIQTGDYIDLDDVQGQISSLNGTIKKDESVVRTLSLLCNFGNQWGDFQPCDIAEYESLISQKQGLIDEQKSINLMREQHNNTVTQLKTRLAQLESEKAQLQSKRADDLPSVELLEKEINEILYNESQLVEKIDSLRQSQSITFQEIQVQKHSIELQNKLNFLNEELKKHESHKTQHESNIASFSKELQSWSELELAINKSQLQALESVIDSLNTSAQIYLDRFFPDCGTSIKIMPFKQNKDGSVTDKVGIQITHNGVEYKSLNEFSGGAENRAILAFQLAISDLVASPLLLLDEPLVGVHESLRNEIYECIREVASNKLIVVVEHGAPENLFDLVVQI